MEKPSRSVEQDLGVAWEGEAVQSWVQQRVRLQEWQGGWGEIRRSLNTHPLEPATSHLTCQGLYQRTGTTPCRSEPRPGTPLKTPFQSQWTDNIIYVSGVPLSDQKSHF